MLMKHHATVGGFSLIEMVVFIVVVGIAAVAILVPLSTVLGVKSPTSNYQTTALKLAQERVELILGNRRLNGYPAGTLTDPCNNGTPPSVCTALTGYTVTPTITASTSIGGDTNYTLITVVTTGLGTATVKMLVGKYQ